MIPGPFPTPEETMTRTTYEKMLDAEEFGSRWLAKGNEYDEAGNHKKAEECYAKGQFWLDRYNKLAGNA